jgi:small subunit ribosomal protein S2
MAVVTMRQLLESGVHFGHQTRRWNPKMKRFIMTERNGIYIIDLQQSLAYIDRSYAFIKETVAKGGTVMFVGTKKQAQEAIAEQATRVGMPYVNQRWLGGMLTNFQTVHQRINRLKELDEIDFDDVAGSSRTKKELLQMRRERDKLNKSLGGIREMSRTPAAVWIVDTNKEHLAVEEARKLRIPIIGILDSNCDPDLVDFPIPGNEGAAEVGAEEPLAEWERELLGGDAEKAAVQATGGDAGTETPASEATGAASEAAEATQAAAAVTEEPAAEAATEEPATEEPAAEAVTEEPAAEAVTEEPAAEPATDEAKA